MFPTQFLAPNKAWGTIAWVNALLRGIVGARKRGISRRLGDEWERWGDCRVTLKLQLEKVSSRWPDRDVEGRRVAPVAETSGANAWR